ncbi:MAG: element excision factor XisH family protein [Saprospiraceae bacterium]
MNFDFQLFTWTQLYYLFALEEQDVTRVLFLAVPKATFEEFFQRPFVQKVIQRKNIRLIIYEPLNQIISQWIK